MDSIIKAISTVGFPIVMCGAICYWVNKVLLKLMDVISENTRVVRLLASKMGLDDVTDEKEKECE